MCRLQSPTTKLWKDKTDTQFAEFVPQRMAINAVWPTRGLTEERLEFKLCDEDSAYMMSK